MPSPRELIKAATDILHNNEVGREGHVLDFWRSIEWIEHKTQVLKSHAELSRTNDAYVNLYPSLTKQPDGVLLVLREFGIFLKAKGGERAERVWENKLTTPDSADIDVLADKLRDPAVRAKAATYDDVIATYPEQGHAVQRLIAIHIVNALRLHHMPYADSEGVDIKTWGPSTEFATGRKYFSLNPLMAYVPRDVCDCFGWAFAEFIVNNCDCVVETSTRYAFKKVVRQVVQRSA